MSAHKRLHLMVAYREVLLKRRYIERPPQVSPWTLGAVHSDYGGGPL